MFMKLTLQCIGEQAAHCLKKDYASYQGSRDMWADEVLQALGLEGCLELIREFTERQGFRWIESLENRYRKLEEHALARSAVLSLALSHS